MRYITGQPRISRLIDEFRIPTHPFDPIGGPERSVMRGVVGRGAEDPEAGYLEDNVFYHPGLNIEITWPNGWKVTNSAANVSATDGAAAIQLTIETTKDGPSDPVAYVEYLKQQGEISTAQGQGRTINGQKAWVGRVTSTKGGQGEGDFAVAFIDGVTTIAASGSVRGNTIGVSSRPWLTA